MAPPSLRKYIALRDVDFRIVFGLIALNTICLFFYRQLDYVANAYHRTPVLTFLEEAVGGMAGAAVFPLIYLVAIRFPLPSAKWRLNVLVHLVAVCVVSLIHTTLIALFRLALFPLFGFAQESYGYLPARYPMEFSHLFIYYWFGVSLIYFFHEIRFARERELQQARLEGSLAEAQLQNLRLQLEPHFLFNALNAISAAIYEDPRVADEMIGRLGDLLRRLFKEDRSQLIPLSQEIEILSLYTSIMQARFEDRLTVTLDIADRAKPALVPQLILQPLMENAIRHGMDSNFEAHIVIQALCEQSFVQLTVRDHGPGLADGKPLTMGVGLRNTMERLERLYGKNASCEIRNAPGGGAIVAVRLPLQAQACSTAVEQAALTAQPGAR
jgi:two-component system LytT family sensor kinase